MDYYHKYLKYKFKYFNLKGGNTPTKEPLLPQTPNQPIKLPKNITASSEYTPEKNNCNTICFQAIRWVELRPCDKKHHFPASIFQ